MSDIRLCPVGQASTCPIPTQQKIVPANAFPLHCEDYQKVICTFPLLPPLYPVCGGAEARAVVTNNWCTEKSPLRSTEINVKHIKSRDISNNVVRATSESSDQPVHTRSLIRAFASHLNIP